jgi:hypothetical protein
MKLTTLLIGLLASAPTLAQTVTSFTPVPNAPAAPRAATVAATLSAPAGIGAASGLKVFSAQSGGKKSGTTTVLGNTITFAPTSPFKPGETVAATLASGAAVPKVWQFTAAATGGSGSFGSSSTLSVPYSIGPMQLADIDGDGDLDLLTFSLNVQSTSSATMGIGVVKVHLNNRLGAFTTASTIQLAPQSLYVAGFTSAMSIADADSDGDLDILVRAVDASVFLLTNDGAGSFVVSLSISSVYTSSLAIVVGDVDGDGDLDYIATSRGGSSHVFTASYFVGINNGNGGFTTGNTGNLVYGQIITALRDVNDDGALDAIGASYSTNRIYAMLNNGSGTFGQAVPLSASGDNISSWAVEDYDADGDLDLAVVSNTCATCNATLKILANDGIGNFSTSSSSTYAYGARLNSYRARLNSADVDGDGRIDLLLTGAGYTGMPADTLMIMRNSASNGFSRPVGYAIPRNGGVIATGDVDADGDIDVVASTFAMAAFPAGATTMLNGLGSALATARPVATSFSVWPNPVSTTSALKVTLAVPALQATAVLATVLGQPVRTQPFKGTDASLVTTGMAPGIYLLTVQADGQSPLTRRVVVE